MVEGLQLALIGIAVVFAFLAALVLAMQALGWCFRTYGHLLPEADAKGRPQTPGLETLRIAAAVAAIEAHRRRRAGKIG